MASSLSEWVEEFILDRQARGRAPRTIADYRRVLGPFASWLGTQGMALSKRTVRRYVAHLRTDHDWAEATVALHVRNLRSFLHWLYEEGLIEENLGQVIPVPRKSVRSFGLTAEMIRRMAERCLQESEDETLPPYQRLMALRDRAVILTLADTGLRVGEFVRLNREDVQVGEGGRVWFLVYMPKVGRYRNAFLGVRATAAVKRYLEARDDEDVALWIDPQRRRRLAYVGVYRLLKRRAKQVDVPPRVVYPHAFRTFFATQWIANGGDEQRLQQLGGWSSRAMLDVYVQLSRHQDLMQGHQRYGPVDRLWE